MRTQKAASYRLAGDLVPGHALGQAFEHKAYAQARTANARLPAQRVGILDDPTHVRIVARRAIDPSRPSISGQRPRPQYLFHDPAAHVGQAEVAALVAIR